MVVPPETCSINYTARNPVEPDSPDGEMMGERTYHVESDEEIDCPNCGKPVRSGLEICPHCEASLN